MYKAASFAESDGTQLITTICSAVRQSSATARPDYRFAASRHKEFGVELISPAASAVFKQLADKAFSVPGCVIHPLTFRSKTESVSNTNFFVSIICQPKLTLLNHVEKMSDAIG